MILNTSITGGVAGLDKVTAVPEAVRSGVTFMDSSGELKTGNMPDAGSPYVDTCTYDHATKTVTVHARNPQAGEVKSPDGETRQFHIEVPEEPQVTGVVYEYDVTNMSHSPQFVSADDEAHPGELYPYSSMKCIIPLRIGA